VTAADGAVVCDASVLVPLVFREPSSGAARALTRSRRLYAPSLLRYEVAQVTVRRCAFGAGDTRQVLQAFSFSLRLPLRLLTPSWLRVIELARAQGLSACDASYLELARALGIPLATFDKRLGQAAEALGIRAVAPDLG
jgi:predicted nucleic acid-binding protein